MSRRRFLRQSALLGLGAPLIPGLFGSCAEDLQIGRRFQTNFDGSVLIIGAGAAGLTAAHLLQQHGITYQVLEAAATHGGRVKASYDFADFPIDLGAEWIHTEPTILAEMLNDPTSDAQVDFIKYGPKEIHVWKNDELRKRNIFSNFYSEYKFKRTTWFDFFEDFIVPRVSDQIAYQQEVVSISYGSNRVEVTTRSGEIYEADRLILTVPLTTLKNGSITFDPPLPSAKTQALEQVDMPDGIKVFIKMAEQFYPDAVFDGGVIRNLLDADQGEKLFYDAAFRKDSTENVLALFTVGEPATIYAQQDDDSATMNVLMEELDRIFDGAASRHYQDHIVQNWSKEPFIQGSYSHYRSYGERDTLRAPVDNKIFFAGETYPSDDDIIATVHGASLSAFEAVEVLLAG